MRIALFVCLLACWGCVNHEATLKRYPYDKVGRIGVRDLCIVTIEGHHYYAINNTDGQISLGPEVPPKAFAAHLHRLEGVTEFITLPEQE